MVDVFAMAQARVALAGAPHAVARVRQEQSAVQLLEFQFEPARHIPALADVTRQILVHGAGELPPAIARLIGIPAA